MTPTRLKTFGVEREEVHDILSDNGALVVVGPRQQRVVGQSGETRHILHGNSVVPASSELPGNRWAVHLVDEKPHRALRVLPRLHLFSASAEYCRSRVTHSSTASLWSA